ncbi:MAG: protein-disulfide reductase DsbD N-terminal domain-containing protein [Casimicrobiaceae bacterium]
MLAVAFVAFVAFALASVDARAASSTVTSAPSAQLPGALLPVDQAFPIHATRAEGRLIIRFDVVPGHYLYRDRFEAAVQGKEAAIGRLPEGKVRDDAFFGKVAVFDQPVDVAVVLPATGSSAAPVVVAVRYQGCSERAGVCYPPVTRSFRVGGDRVELLPAETVRPALGTPSRRLGLP